MKKVSSPRTKTARNPGPVGRVKKFQSLPSKSSKPSRPSKPSNPRKTSERSSLVGRLRRDDEDGVVVYP
ncbi:MAG: hypothetical protein Q4D98_10700 [Planctomycetia bacterium]|nr:hypothetical protein [Planctomycetia bacterium]